MILEPLRCRPDRPSNDTSRKGAGRLCAPGRTAFGLDCRGAGSVQGQCGVDESRDGEGAPQFAEFFERADRRLVLRAAGVPDVHAEVLQSWWVDPRREVAEFYVRIPALEFDKMRPGKRYELVARNEGARSRWNVADGVAIRKGR